MMKALLMIVFQVCVCLTLKGGDQVLMHFPNSEHLTSSESSQI